MRAHRRITVALLCALAVGCTGGVGRRALLREYRVVAPKRQVVQPVWLAAFTTDEVGGRLSPDGRSLLYAGDQKGSLDIWVKDLTTGIPKRLTSHVAIDTQPAWSPDGKRVVFVSMRKDVKGDLYLWEGGSPIQLTDRRAAEAYPTFAPDGRSVYMASGPEGLTRIERLDLKSKERTPLTDWDATHPAISPDGRLLAYTQFDENRRGRIAVLDLQTRKARLLTTPEYHAGFPAFSRDGRRLLFSRFTVGSPQAPVQPDTEAAVASLWEVDLRRALAAGSPEQAMPLARPLTSGRYTVLFVQDSGFGLVFTTSRAGSLDIGMLPENGPVPRLSTAAAQLALARAQDNPRDRLLCLDYVQRFDRGAEASRARYLMASIHRELEEFDPSQRILEGLAREPSEEAQLARIDLVALPVEQQAARGKVDAVAVHRALKRLGALKLPSQPSSVVAAHLVLRRGDLQRLGGRVQASIKSYETLVERHPEVREAAVQAKFHLGTLFARVRDPDLLATYYLTLFAQYPEQGEWLRRAGEAVLALYKDRPPEEQVEILRALVDAHPRCALFGARAEIRIGQLYEQLDQLDLAIAAMARVTRAYPGKAVVRERTEAAFELGRLSLANYERLREAGRLSEALSSYDKALAAYAQLLKTFEPGHEHHTRARTEFLRLSLLMAAQLERDGEAALAEKRYRALLAIDPENLQAHRKLIELGVDQGRRDALERDYDERVDRDPGDAVGHYGLGYLATFPAGETLAASDLDRAEEHLKRAASLSPQSPFGHMTLGWVFEMRERLLGQSGRGWLEEAIDLYDRAYSLNDAKLDVQTEADLLVNLCNSFANLGNGWRQALEFCEKRRALKIPFISKRRAAAYHLTFGRAASAMGKHDLADEQLEQAYDLARDLGLPRLEAEAVSRRALTAHLQGDAERSNRYFEAAMALYRKQGRQELLPGLSRSVALNLVLARQHHKALEQLAETGTLLDQHGTPPIEPFMAVEKVGCTTAPYGFDKPDESYLTLALKQQVYRARQEWHAVAPLLEQRIASRKQALEQREHQELAREVALLQNSLGLARLKLGQRGAFAKSLQTAIAALEKMQTDEKTGQLTPDAELFPLLVALELNRAEQLLAALAAGHAEPPTLREGLGRLQRLEEVRAAQVAKESKPLLGPRLRMSLFADLALLSFYHGLSAGPPAAAGKGPRPPAAERALQQLATSAEPFVKALRLLRRVMAETDPERPPEDPEVVAEAREAAAERGVLGPLWRPLSRREELRWYLAAALNLVRLSAAFTPAEQLADHPSTELLRQLAALGLKRELGAWRFAIAAELAYRRADPRAMELAVRGFLDLSPLLLEERGTPQAARLRRLVFGRAVALALRKPDLAAAVAWAEQEERRGFADELVALPPAGWGRAAKPLKALLDAAAAYRRHLATEVVAPTPPPTSAPATTPAPATPDPWRAQLNKLEQTFAERRRALAKGAPRVAALFEVPEFPHKQLLGALAEGDVAITALVSDGKVLLVALAPKAEPTAGPLKQDLATLRRPGQLDRALAPILARLAKGARRVYVDLGRIDPALAAGPLLPKGTRGVRLATLWELVDAHDVRNLALAKGRVADARPGEAKRLAQVLGFEAVTGDKLRLARVDLPFEQAGFLLWNQPLRFDGGPATNVRLPLDDPKGQRLDDLRLGRALGFPLRGHLLALVAPRHTPGRERAERIALLRLAHAMGVPAVLVLDSPTQVQLLKPIVAGLERSDLAGAVQASAAKGATLFGYGGLEPEAAQAFAKAQLGATARAGVKAFGQRKLPEAVEQLEATLRYIDYLQDFKYLDGALEFLAQSYTLLEDYRRAVPLMERLLALRVEAIEKERKAGGKKVLAAQAKWVKALTDMAWLRMRNKEYDAALAANKQAIALYHEVKRPLLALDSYVQRAIIAEKKGDNREALTYAEKALQTARATLTKSPKSASARSDVAAAAGRVARYQRMLFSNYRAAMTAARMALDQIPQVKPEERAAVETEGRGLMAKKAALQAKAKEKPKDKALAAQLAAVTKQLTALVARHKAMGKALGDRVQAVLEISRIQSARGDYNRAADAAEQALELARAAGLPDAEPALLELVNNLYYTGAFGPALARASEGLSLTKLPVRRIQFHNARGSIYAALGQTAQAKTELEAALAIATRLKNPAEMAASHNNLGNAMRLAGRFDGAKRQFRKALEIDRRREDKLGMAFDYANLGLAEELMGRARDAKEHLERALALSSQIGAPLNELKALAGLGRMSISAGQAKQALDHFRRGQRIATRLGLRNWSWRFDLLEGRALRRLRQLGPARAALERGIKLVEGRPPRLRKALGVPKVEEEPEDLYDELVDLLSQQKLAEAAFDVSERMRARGFIDLVSQSSPSIPLEQAREKLKAVTRLQGELEAARAAEMRATAAADRKAASQEVQRAQAELDAASNALAAINPRLPALVVVDAWPLARLRSLVGPNHLVLSYVPTPERLVIFALRGSKLQMHVVRVSRAELTRTVQRYREALLSFHPVQDLSRKLHRWLLAPVLGKGSPERLVLVPAGPLHLLPFAALEDDRGQPLVERHALSYLASVNHLRQPAPTGVDAQAKRSTRRAKDAPRRVAFGWAGKPPHPLSFTLRETEAFGVTFPGAEVVQGPEATRARLLEEAPTADLVHVATHGEFHEEAPLRTALQLADGSLPLLEVLGLKLKPGALVLLSACETGTGQLDGADAAVGLHQAFLAAGADRVVSSLYRVSDLGAALLMKHLFRRLAAGVAPALALREAQQRLRRRFPHPAFWAAFRLDGAP